MVERKEDCHDEGGSLAEPANMAGEVPLKNSSSAMGPTKPLDRK
ncbi:MAG: hypothetical protein VB088_00095 [Sphaerochaeta sp.]|nr:hypothetical protein [Sphaerochaeta sp.]